MHVKTCIVVEALSTRASYKEPENNKFMNTNLSRGNKITKDKRIIVPEIGSSISYKSISNVSSSITFPHNGNNKSPKR